MVFRAQRRHEEQLEALGVTPNYSCVSYLYQNVPRFGEILGWAESSAVIWANSVAGARTNRNSIMMDVCQAVTGLTPEFGYLRDEHRRGQLLVRLDVQRMDAAALGFLVGRLAVDRVPVLEHWPFTQAELKNMGAAMASSGAVTMYHVIGVTPEARDAAMAFGGRPHGRPRGGERRRARDGLVARVAAGIRKPADPARQPRLFRGRVGGSAR